MGDDNQDCNPLGSNLAHASFPNEGSNFIHFNYMNTWNGKPDVRTVFLTCISPYLIYITREYVCFYLLAEAMLFKVAMHEIGHTLGLHHSEDSVIMYEYTYEHTPESSYLELSWDDYNGINVQYQIKVLIQKQQRK